MYALPHTLEDTKAEIDDIIKIEITGEADGIWYFEYNGKSWRIIDSLLGKLPVTEISIDQDFCGNYFRRVYDQMI